MNIVLIYGPPAVGKKTIGQELHLLTQYRFFHNHLVVDTVLSLFDFGTPSFIKMREKLWDSLLDEAVQSKVPGVIFTFNPESSVPVDYIPRLVDRLKKQGAKLSIIKITAPETVLEERMDLPSRHASKKLTSLSLYRELRDAGVFDDQGMPAPDLEIDSSQHSAAESAQLIQTFLQKK